MGRVPRTAYKTRPSTLSPLPLAVLVSILLMVVGGWARRLPPPPLSNPPSWSSATGIDPFDPFLEGLRSTARAAGGAVAGGLAPVTLPDGSRPLVAVARSGAVPPDAARLFQGALGRAGTRLSASGLLLLSTVEAQDLLQSPIYPPSPRRRLAPASVLAVISGSISGGQVVVEAAAVALTPLRLGDRTIGPGEVVPNTRFQGVVAPPRGWAPVVGLGYCNRSLPHRRWRYSAERAALINARAQALLERGGGGLDLRLQGGPILERDGVHLSGRLPWPGGRVVAVGFDPGRCEAQALLLLPAP